MLGCVAVTSTATGSAVVHRDVRWVFPPFRLHFICCADAGSCNKSRQALDDDLVRAVKLCLITTKKMISEGIHRVFKKRALQRHSMARRACNRQAQPPAQ